MKYLTIITFALLLTVSTGCQKQKPQPTAYKSFEWTGNSFELFTFEWFENVPNSTKPIMHQEKDNLYLLDNAMTLASEHGWQYCGSVGNTVLLVSYGKYDIFFITKQKVEDANSPK
jgi:hypothetical protein